MIDRLLFVAILMEVVVGRNMEGLDDGDRMQFGWDGYKRV